MVYTLPTQKVHIIIFCRNSLWKVHYTLSCYRCSFWTSGYSKKIHSPHFSSLMMPWRSCGVDKSWRQCQTHVGWRDLVVVTRWICGMRKRCKVLLPALDSPFWIVWGSPRDRHLSFNFLSCTLALCTFWVLQLLLDVGLCNSRKSPRALLPF